MKFIYELFIMISMPMKFHDEFHDEIHDEIHDEFHHEIHV